MLEREHPRPQRRKNWGELNSQSGKFAGSCFNDAETCATLFIVARLNDASKRVITSRAIVFNQSDETTRSENNV